MYNFFNRKFLLVSILVIVSSCRTTQHFQTEVKVAGAMHLSMWNGEIQGKIALDTLIQKPHMYGLGPVEGLQGEIMLWDSRPLVSRVSETGMSIQEEPAVQAPFFVYAQVNQWEFVPLPEHIRDLASLERHLMQLHAGSQTPFPFRLKGTIQGGKIHIVNLPDGAVVRSPEEAHQGIVYYPLQQEEVEILGFFSTQHEMVFTHKKHFTHLHLMTADGKQLGHVDALQWSVGGLQLGLPKLK